MNNFFYTFIIFLLCTFTLHVNYANGKNILVAFGNSGKSHFFMYEQYVEKLAERGHKITLLTGFNTTNINMNENVKVIKFEDEIFNFVVDLTKYESTPKILMKYNEISYINEAGQRTCRNGLSNSNVKKLIESKKHFDVVVVEYFNTDCFSILSHIFKAPLVGIFSSAPLPWHNDRMGNPDNPSYVAHTLSEFSSEMNFYARLKNSLSLFFSKTYYNMYSNGPTDKIIKRNLGKGIPKVKDIVSNTSLFLVNSHFSLFQSRPLVPSMVEVGGIHLRPPKNLPPDLQSYFDKSKDGIIYFSFGSATNISTLSTKRKNAILKGFNNVTENVLMKWDADDMPEKPENVLLKKWVPQNDVLGKFFFFLNLFRLIN